MPDFDHMTITQRREFVRDLLFPEIDDSLRVQLDAANKRIRDLEVEVDRLSYLGRPNGVEPLLIQCYGPDHLDSVGYVSLVNPSSQDELCIDGDLVNACRVLTSTLYSARLFEATVRIAQANKVRDQS